MAAPEIALLDEVLRSAGLPVEALPSGWERARYVVLRAGEFHGRAWRVGEGIACVAAVEEEERPVVLVARGPGRPRLGTAEGDQVRGDAGEPCSLQRWEVAGAVEELPAAAEVVQACLAAVDRRVAALRGGSAYGVARGRRGEAAPSRPAVREAQPVVDRGARWGDRVARPRPASPQLSLFARAA